MKARLAASPHRDQGGPAAARRPKASQATAVASWSGALRTLAGPRCWPLSNGFGGRSQESPAHH